MRRNLAGTWMSLNNQNQGRVKGEFICPSVAYPDAKSGQQAGRGSGITPRCFWDEPVFSGRKLNGLIPSGSPLLTAGLKVRVLPLEPYSFPPFPTPNTTAFSRALPSGRVKGEFICSNRVKLLNTFQQIETDKGRVSCTPPRKTKTNEI